MPKFTVNASFSLQTEIEPDGINLTHSLDLSETADDESAEDESYFRSQEIECDGGDVRFVVEASDEYEAEQKAGGIISDGMEVEDNSGLTWLITNVSFDIEAVEEEMTVEKAKNVVKAWLVAVPRTGMDGDLIPSEVRAALLFLLDRVA